MELIPFTALISSLKQLYFTTRDKSWSMQAGIHYSKERDINEDFYEVRNYSLGDPLKNIDWKKYAQTHHVYTKVGVKQPNQKVLIYLDSSSSQKVSLHKYNITWLTTLSIAYILKKQYDNIILLTDNIIFPNQENFFHLKTEKDFYTVNDLLLKDTHKIVKNIAQPTLLNYLRLEASGIGKIIWVTDLYISLLEFEKTLNYLQKHKYNASIVHMIDESEWKFELDNDHKKRKFFGRFIDFETKQWVSSHKIKAYKQLWEDAIKKRISAIKNRNYFYTSGNIKDGPIKIISKSHFV